MDRREWLQSSGAALLGSLAIPLIGGRMQSVARPAVEAGPVRMHLNENPYGPSPKVFERFMDFA